MKKRMVNININFEKRHFIVFLLAASLIVSLGYVYATATSDPDVFGHTENEIAGVAQLDENDNNDSGSTNNWCRGAYSTGGINEETRITCNNAGPVGEPDGSGTVTQILAGVGISVSPTTSGASTYTVNNTGVPGPTGPQGPPGADGADGQDGTGDITNVQSGEGTKGGATSGLATIEFDCSETDFDDNGLSCSGEDLVLVLDDIDTSLASSSISTTDRIPIVDVSETPSLAKNKYVTVSSLESAIGGSSGSLDCYREFEADGSAVDGTHLTAGCNSGYMATGGGGTCASGSIDASYSTTNGNGWTTSCSTSTGMTTYATCCRII